MSGGGTAQQTPSSSSSSPPAIRTAEQIIAERVERWNDCENLEETTLIHLSILRDILRSIHAEKSRCLAMAHKQEAQDFRAWEKRIEELRNASPLAGDLMTLLLNPALTRRRTRLLPDSLFAFIDKEKLDRYDRTWEAAIAAEAASLGWCFWSLDAWVEIPKVEAWHERLSETLLPHGVVLFAETSTISADANDPAQANLWHGVWYVVLKARYRSPEFHVETFDGTSPQPAPPLWRLLFSPKRR